MANEVVRRKAVDQTIEGMNEFCDIKSDGLTMDQIFHSDSVWSLYEGSILNT